MEIIAIFAYSMAGICFIAAGYGFYMSWKIKTKTRIMLRELREKRE